MYSSLDKAGCNLYRYSLLKLFILKRILCVALLLLLHSTLKYKVFFGFSDYVYRLLVYEYILTTMYICVWI